MNGCCDDLQHRGAVMAFDGVAKIPERFAIDFIKLDGDRRVVSGPADRNESYAGYGAPVYAVADGTVIATSDGAPERIPTKPREPIRFDTAGGNFVVVDIGGGNYAFFAHLKTGTVAVKPGDRVKTGDVVGHLGDTGNSDGPHLHFHVMDGPSPFGSNGVPYAFSTFSGAGRLTGDNDGILAGDPAKIDNSWRPARTGRNCRSTLRSSTFRRNRRDCAVRKSAAAACVRSAAGFSRSPSAPGPA